MRHKIGDLVTISYETERIGIVTEIRENSPFPYKVKWIREGRLIRYDSDFGHYSEGVVIPLEVLCNSK